jgi:hypothetical protein
MTELDKQAAEDKVFRQYREQANNVRLLTSEAHDIAQKLESVATALRTEPWLMTPSASSIAADGEKIVLLVDSIKRAFAERARLYSLLSAENRAFVTDKPEQSK